MAPQQVTNRFIGNAPEFVPLDDGVRSRVAHPFTYVDPWGKCIDVPQGFTTDFASVPPLARFAAILLALAWYVSYMFPSLSCAMFAVGVGAWVIILLAEWLENRSTDAIAAVHDWIYATRCRPRWRADWILFMGMNAQGAPHNGYEKRFLFWFNVRLAGWKPWADDARRIENRQWTAPPEV